LKTSVCSYVAGTCTDAHESIETKNESKRIRQQLLGVIAESHMTMFTVDSERKITMLEGAMIWDTFSDSHASRRYVGENVYDVFSRLSPRPPKALLEAVESILSGKIPEDLEEHEIGKFISSMDCSGPY
jgi:hypothetical protein